MSYINEETGEFGITEQQIRSSHPQTIFPTPFEPDPPMARVVETAPQSYNANTHRVEETAPQKEGGVWQQRWRVVQLTAAELAERLAAEQARLTAAATALRWEVETGGVTFPDGTRVGSTIEDQNRIDSAIGNAEAAGIASVDFKAASGWLSLSIAELRGISAAIAIHVQGCFSAERAHHEAITALKTLSAARTYDVGQGWPT